MRHVRGLRCSCSWRVVCLRWHPAELVPRKSRAREWKGVGTRKSWRYRGGTDSEMNAISWQRCAVSGDPANFATLKRAGEYYMYAAEYAHATGNASEANYLIGKALKIFAQMRSVKSVRGQLLDETLNDVRIAKRESNGEWPRV